MCNKLVKFNERSSIMEKILVTKLNDNEIKLTFPKGVTISKPDLSVEELYLGLTQALVKVDTDSATDGCLIKTPIGCIEKT